MEMLQLMKILLSIDTEDISKDAILNHFISKSQAIIKGYCNLQNIPQQHMHAVVDYAIYLYKNKESEGYKQQSQGERRIQYDGAIPESIKIALPIPKIKVGGY